MQSDALKPSGTPLVFDYGAPKSNVIDYGHGSSQQSSQEDTFTASQSQVSQSSLSTNPEQKLTGTLMDISGFQPSSFDGGRGPRPHGLLPNIEGQDHRLPGEKGIVLVLNCIVLNEQMR